MGVAITLADIAKCGLLGGGSGSGGGGASDGVSPKEVNFYDYDGTCVHAYTVAEAQALSALPAGPEHEGLVFQGWNWSLEGVKGLTRAMNIGAMYTTDDGTTRLYITLQEGRTSPMLGVGVNGTVTVDWGDGTEPDVLTGTSVSTTQWTPNHAYAAPGDYVIRLTVDGSLCFTGRISYANDGSHLLRNDSADGYDDWPYRSAIKKVESSEYVTSLGQGALDDCIGLEEYVCHNDVAMASTHMISGCRNLKYFSVSSKATAIKGNMFANDSALEQVSFSEKVSTIGDSAFRFCTALRRVTIPDGVSQIESYAFQYCYRIKDIELPNSLTAIGSNAFENCQSLRAVIIPSGVVSIPSSAFSLCYSLSSVVCRGDVTSIGSNAFKDCCGVGYYDFTACTSVPTLANTSAFSGIPDDCEIRVPAALYDEWIAATNWTTYADRCVAK